MKKKFLSYLLFTFSCLYISTLTSAQTNAPNGAIQVPNPTLSPVATPAGYSGISSFNHIRVWIPQQPYQDATQVMLAERKPEEVLQSVQYFDGMGKPIQSVAKQIGPDAFGKQDAVSTVTYDAFGRVAQQYLPYMSSTNDGKIKTNPFVEQNTFYTSTYVNDQPSLTNEKFFYGQTNYEASPLNRVISSYAPGNSWVGSNRGGTGQNTFNTEADSVVIWKIRYDDAISDDKNIPYTAGRYAATMLSKQISKDEQGNTAIIYTDREGHVILKKAQRSTSFGAGHSGWSCTYYIYDELGLLRCIIQPGAVQYMNSNTWDLTSTLLSEQCFRYEYDERHRMIAKKVPGSEWLYMIYDKRDRLVFTQDGNLRAKNQWNTTLYDELNRVVSTGITTYAGSRQQLIDYVNSLGSTNTTITINGNNPSAIQKKLLVSERQEGRQTYQASEEVVFDGEFNSESTAEFTAEIVPPSTSTFSSQIIIADNPVPSIGTYTALTLNYYDDYSFTTTTYDNSNNAKLDKGSNAYADPLPNSASTKTYGLTTGSKVRIIDPSDLSKGEWLSAIYFYDDNNRLIQTRSTNHKGGEDILTQRYSFTGKVVCTYDIHNNPAAGISNLKLKTNLNYDHAGRLMNITKQLNDDNSTSRTIATYVYDHMGQLKTKQLGQKRDIDGTLTTSPLDNIDYSYNIRGWLSGINTAFANNKNNNNYFGSQLNYDWGFQNSLYNGNIAGVQWRTKGSDVQRAYGFGYDNTNQLLFADFNQNYNAAWGKTAAGGAINLTALIGNGTDGATAYDNNGNVKKLQQWGLKIGSSPQIDNLQYSYNISNLSNKLSAVTEDDTIADKDNKLDDFTDGNRSGNDYAYDVNGNLIQDKNKKITSITYNHLDLPSVITVEGKGTITYTYDATGKRLDRKVEELGTGKTTLTTYMGAVQYVDNNLKFITHEEGRIRPLNNTAVWAYDYFEKDHLGSIRVVLTDEYKKDNYPAATMESENAAVENSFYSNIETTRAPKPSGFTGGTGTNNFVSQVNGNGNKIGPGIILKVMAGDQLSIKVNSYYDLGGSSPTNNNSVVNDIISVLANQIPSSSAGKISGGTVSGTVLQNPISAFMDVVGSSANTVNTKPAAYLNYVLLDDEQLAYVEKGSGCKQVGEDKTVTILNNTITVPRNGYIYIFTSNATKDVNVYFDELQVTHARGALLEEMSYYPFGGQIAGLHSKAAGGLQSRYSFQSQEYEADLGLDLYAFEARQYDAQIGRWHVPDPADQFHNLTPYGGMGNNPIAHVDPDGRFLWLAVAIGAILGGYSGYQVAKAKGATGWDMFGYILGGAFVGGVSAGTGAAISNSGIAFSQTLALGASSAINSAGMQLLSGGQTDFTISLGIASYNFSKGEWGYLGKKGNSFLDNVGYSLGALTNIQDVLAGFHPGSAYLETEKLDKA